MEFSTTRPVFSEACYNSVFKIVMAQILHKLSKHWTVGEDRKRAVGVKLIPENNAALAKYRFSVTVIVHKIYARVDLVAIAFIQHSSDVC